MSFKRVTGALSDVRELEYIAALHQTCLPDTRANGTVSSLDIQRFLASRYGLHQITHGQHTIPLIRSLGGGTSQEAHTASENKKLRIRRLLGKFIKKKEKEPDDLETGEKKLKEPNDGEEVTDISADVINENIISDEAASLEKLDQYKKQNDFRMADDDDDLTIPEEYLDLVQMLAILLIPTLARAALANERSEGADDVATPQAERGDDDMFESLDPHPPNMIDQAVKIMLKNVFVVEPEGEHEDSPVLDEQLVEALLLEVGEHERAQDQELLQEMVEVAGGKRRFDAAALAHALTSDLKQWKVRSEDNLSTFWDDVFGDGGGGDSTSKSETPAAARLEVVGEKMQPDTICVDYVVDSHTSVVTVGIIWTFYFMVRIAVFGADALCASF